MTTTLGAVEPLRTSLRGEAIEPSSPDYESARSLYNAMVDKRPALIVRCRDAADVRAARRVRSPRRARGGRARRRAQRPGLGSVDDGLVIDLSPMNGVRVDPEARLATVQGGALVGDLDHAAGGFALAVPAGIISTTGVGGLTLGGGHGYLTRKLRPHDRQPRLGGRRPRRRQLRHGRARTPTRISSGRCAAAAATSASSRRSRSGCTRSRPSSAGRPCGRSRPRPTCCAGTAISSRPRREDVYGFFAFLTVPPARRSHRSCTCGRCAASSGAAPARPSRPRRRCAPP